MSPESSALPRTGPAPVGAVLSRLPAYPGSLLLVAALNLALARHLPADVGRLLLHKRMRVQVRDAKGNRDRLVPLPQATLAVLRRFWLTHRHPELLFPNRSAGLKGALRASSPLDRGGVQLTLRKVATACGLKKRSPLTVCATAMPRT